MGFLPFLCSAYDLAVVRKMGRYTARSVNRPSTNGLQRRRFPHDQRDDGRTNYIDQPFPQS